MSEPGLRSLGDDRWTLTLVRALDHPPEKVWRAITEPRHLARWYPMAAEHLDLRVGGAITFRDEEGTELPAEVTEVEPGRVFAFREFDVETGEHHLRLGLEADGEGGCRLTLTHTFIGGDWAERTETGWLMCLDELERALAEGG